MKLSDYQEQLIEQIKQLLQEEGRDVSRLSGAYERVIDLVQNDITNQIKENNMKKRLPVWSFSKVNTDALEANRGYVELDRKLLPGHGDTHTVLLLAPISANGLPDLDQQFRIVVDSWGEDASMNDATQIGFVNRVTTFEALEVEDDL